MSGAFLEKFIPVLNWLPQYRKEWFRFDLIAGLTVAAVAIPQSMAYAKIAGLPVQVGLYTALVPMLVYALMGTSRSLSVGATSAISILTATALVWIVPNGDPAQYMTAAFTLALLVGAILLVAGILRLGFLANFISIPVLTGFKAGLGLVIIAGQLGVILGIPVGKGPFFQTILSVLQNLGAVNMPTLILALATLVVLFALSRIAPRLPAPLLVVVFGTLASALLIPDNAGIGLVGHVPSGLPSFVLPDLSLVGKLWPAALGIALMAFTESVAAARAFIRHGDPAVDANQELRALGMANICGSVFQAYPAGGGTSQTAVKFNAGVRSQMAAIVAVGMVVVVLLFLAPVISLMPAATLGAIVFTVAVHLIKVDDFRAIARIRIRELGWALIAVIGVVLLGTLNGILVAVIVSMLNLTYLANHPPVYTLGRKRGTDIFRPLKEYQEDETFDGLLILRTEGRMHFASAPRAGEKLKALIEKAPQPRVVLMDMSAVPGIEYTALTMFIGLEEKLREKDVSLWLAALNPEALATVKKSPLWKTLGPKRLFFNVEQAVEAYVKEERL